ncbi:MAG: NAD-dependent epimerase/dehydratase family protein [Bacteroidia bacterium]|nr:NAD-dependent epimerase/dehydratase family protein [Bacteroidia bacterium]
MKYHLISGGCGFVGRNVARRLLDTTPDRILIVDDLSVGIPPGEWPADGEPFLGGKPRRKLGDLEFWGDDERLLFWRGDFRRFLRTLQEVPGWLQTTYGLEIPKFSDVFHFAAIVGGRSKIDGDPMMVALDLAIDAELFYWAVRHQPDRLLYPSSSAAYPVDLQAESGHTALAEPDIDWEHGKLGQPDMTYGWSKLTGEYLARTAARHYGLRVTCIRPFSGYGEDQDLSYPVPAIAARAARREDPFEVWGTGRQGRDFVHIDDVVDCMLLAMDHIHDGSAINIGSGRITSFLEIIGVFTRFAGYSPEIKPLLDKPVGVHARYGDMAYVRERLGWEPRISVEEGMRRVYEAALRRLEQGA